MQLLVADGWHMRAASSILRPRVRLQQYPSKVRLVSVVAGGFPALFVSSIRIGRYRSLQGSLCSYGTALQA